MAGDDRDSGRPSVRGPTGGRRSATMVRGEAGWGMVSLAEDAVMGCCCDRALRAAKNPWTLEGEASS
jgi:hypothetical protein